MRKTGGNILVMHSNSILLSICIPTYNRGVFLDICLSQICKQTKEFEDSIEVIVSDNCSSDNTEEIVHRFIASGHNINFVKNTENIGADRNFEQCFSTAKGKYVWIFGDDDILLDGSLKKIISICESGNYGNIYISNAWFQSDYKSEIPPGLSHFDYTLYDNKDKYLRKINIMISFATANIFNKSLLPHNFNSKKYLGTNLSQVHWYLNCIFRSEKNIMINSQHLACKSGNTGGYSLFETFGKNFRKICFNEANENEFENSFVSKIDNQLLTNFFPHYIILARSSKYNIFKNEKIRSVLEREFKYNLLYWVNNFPLFYLPLRWASIYFRLTRIFTNKIIKWKEYFMA